MTTASDIINQYGGRGGHKIVTKNGIPMYKTPGAAGEWRRLAKTPLELIPLVSVIGVGGNGPGAASQRRELRRYADGWVLWVEFIGCLKINRERQRKRGGCRPWRPGGRGRPPAEQQH